MTDCKPRGKLLTAVFFGVVLALVALTPQTSSGQAGSSADVPERGSTEGQGGSNKHTAANELIVSFKQPTAPESAIDSLKSVPGAGGAEVEDSIPALDATVISLPELDGPLARKIEKRVVSQVKEALARNPLVESVELNHHREAAPLIPDDPRLNGQYYLNKIGAPKAWRETQGKGADIAVIDSGVAASHPDLDDKITTQRDFVDSDRRAEDNSFTGHGTQVAGIAAAETDNGEGIAGTCPGCDLLVAKSLDSNLSGSDSEIAQAVVWSANNGAEVINLSLGAPIYSELLKNAVSYARSKEAVVVAAAGNAYFGRTDKPIYPAAYPGVIAVSATDKKDQLDPLSETGPYVDVAAPGVGILSTLPGGEYGTYSGTSQASPQVAGVAALLSAEGASPEETRKRIEESAVDLGPEGKDPSFGAGRLDAARALK